MTDKEEDGFSVFAFSVFAFFILVLIILVVVVFCLYVNNFTGDYSTEQAVWGQFGDFFGGTLNPLLSFFSLIAVLMTLIFQNSQLKLLADSQRIQNSQLKSFEDSQQIQIFFHLVDKLQDEEIRKSRGLIFDLYDKGREFGEWDEGEKKTAEKACQSFDVVGMVLKKEDKVKDMIIQGWYLTIHKSWICTEKLVDSRRRDTNNEDLWDDYRWLNEEAIKYGKANKKNMDGWKNKNKNKMARKVLPALPFKKRFKKR